MKTANSTRKMAVVVAAYFFSRRARKSTDAPTLFSFRTRVFSVRHDISKRTALISAIIRIAQGKPILGAAKRIITGNMTPPIPPAVQAMPVAYPRRTLNQCPMQETAGIKRAHADRPPRTLNERNIW